LPCSPGRNEEVMYHFSKVLNASFDEAIALVTDALKAEGMGVLTEINAQAAFKKKLDIDFRRYTILGACHPQTAFQILEEDDKAGVLFPCNVVVQEHQDGRVEVSAVDPLMMFLMVHSSPGQRSGTKCQRHDAARHRSPAHPSDRAPTSNGLTLMPQSHDRLGIPSCRCPPF
jgi:uncharacterized protein (DUF302 family)